MLAYDRPRLDTEIMARRDPRGKSRGNSRQCYQWPTCDRVIDDISYDSFSLSLSLVRKLIPPRGARGRIFFTFSIYRETRKREKETNILILIEARII